ncbi:hypothetical protein [Streptomyces sp. YIM 121038]|uniref:hypothetical protein n=1 Tax=Streptomyces sp. YIM 121038 TaxID=2136401 RepID=UPI001110DF29|nr:hypothetical protein [Streptomyces sp. YIM 121038]
MDADHLDWNRSLREQREVHGNHQLRARLEGLTDDEYFWSPVPDAWSVRPRGSVPIGAKEPFPEAPTADLVLHVHRELIHRLSEVCLPRDLYRHTKPATNGATR